MPRAKLNPFYYGKPVPPDRFVGREDALRTIFGRIYNYESTAVVGEPHIGKTSFLRYIRDERVRADWLGDQTAQFAFIDIDCHMLPAGYQPADFWSVVVKHIEDTFQDPAIQKQVTVVRQSGCGSFTLQRLFELLSRADQHIVLLIDEFEVLLHHPNFNTAEFFGALRTLCSKTDGLVTITFSRLHVAEMNRRSQEINPLGSPFFNTLIEVHLLPLRPTEVDALIDQTLKSSGVIFSIEDRAYISRVSGRHPFLIQIAASALFEISASQEPPADRYTEGDRKIQSWAAVHFADVWHSLNSESKHAALFLALMELDQQESLPNGFNDLAQYNIEMQWLSNCGLIESIQAAQCAIWRGERWRIGASSFTRWLVDTRKWEEMFEPKLLISTNHDEQIASLRKQITTRRRRLRVLEEQAAAFGLSIPPEITLQIEDTHDEIEADERELRKLGGRA